MARSIVGVNGDQNKVKVTILLKESIPLPDCVVDDAATRTVARISYGLHLLRITEHIDIKHTDIASLPIHLPSNSGEGVLNGIRSLGLFWSGSVGGVALRGRLFLIPAGI